MNWVVNGTLNLLVHPESLSNRTAFGRYIFGQWPGLLHKSTDLGATSISEAIKKKYIRVHLARTTLTLC